MCCATLAIRQKEGERMRLAMGANGSDCRSSADDGGCAYILDDVDVSWASATRCAAPRQRGSSYCARHHALCHVADGSIAEARRLRETEMLASAIGGRLGRAGRAPPERFLRRLERVTGGFSRPECSRIVRGMR